MQKIFSLTSSKSSSRSRTLSRWVATSTIRFKLEAAEIPSFSNALSRFLFVSFNSCWRSWICSDVLLNWKTKQVDAWVSSYPITRKNKLRECTVCQIQHIKLSYRLIFVHRVRFICFQSFTKVIDCFHFVGHRLQSGFQFFVPEFDALCFIKVLL